jgi:uncharacterized membrane protein YhhN
MWPSRACSWPSTLGVHINRVSSLLLVVAAVSSLVDWLAIARRHRALQFIFKPAATSAFLGVAITLDPTSGATRVWFCVALVGCLIGDVLLMGPESAFIGGLASFAIAQLCFAVGFRVQHPTGLRFALGAVIAAALAAPVGTRLVRALRSSHEDALVVPVIIYIALIFTMATTAVAGAAVFGVVGAAAFVLSDFILAENRFVAARSWAPVAVMVTYHLALAGLVLNLA